MPIYNWERDKLEVVARQNGLSTLKICTKVLDEPLLIRGWIEHHSRIVGPQNLIIADNMSSDLETLDIYKKYSDQITIFQFSGPHNQIHWHPRFAELFDVLKGTSRFVSFVDADERLVRMTPDEWSADDSIVGRLDIARASGIIPTTWLTNELESFDLFRLDDPEHRSALASNLRWGKPILPSQLVGCQAGIHNIQYESAFFDRSEGTNLFLLHLTQFPKRRIETNRNKLISRGIVPKGTTSGAILSMDFSGRADQSFMPLVLEMKQMLELLEKRQIGLVSNDFVKLRADGSISFSNDDAKAIWREYLDRGPDIIGGTFSGSQRSNDKLDDPSFALNLGIALRDEKRHTRAENVFREGMTRHPHFQGKYGGPGFRKELLRMYLAQRDWSKADQLIDEADPSRSEHWYKILYARAYTQVSRQEDAGCWWLRVLEHEPSNGEAIQSLAALGRSFGEVQHMKSCRESFLEDFDKIQVALDLSQTQVHGFMQRFFDFSQLGVGEVYTKFSMMIDNARRIVAEKENVCSEAKTGIPKKIHRIWLTAQNYPIEPPPRYIEMLLAEAKEYSASGWVHHLWIQDPELIPKTVRTIQSQNKEILISKISDHLASGDWSKVFDEFLVARKFPFAADILRMKILLEYGGIYADLGARFTREKAASIVLKHFDYAFIFWDTMFFQNSLMAMNRQSELARVFLRLVESPYSIPADLLRPLSGLSEGMAFSGLMVTCVLLLIFNENVRVCPLAPNHNLITWASEKSWYTDAGNQDGKHGNAYVPATGPSVFREELLSSAPINAIFRRSQRPR